MLPTRPESVGPPIPAARFYGRLSFCRAAARPRSRPEPAKSGIRFGVRVRGRSRAAATRRGTTLQHLRARASIVPLSRPGRIAAGASSYSEPCGRPEQAPALTPPASRAAAACAKHPPRRPGNAANGVRAEALRRRYAPRSIPDATCPALRGCGTRSRMVRERVPKGAAAADPALPTPSRQESWRA